MNIIADFAARRRFILANTMLAAPPHVPEIKLHLAQEVHDLWHRTEDELQSSGLQPPYWAFARAGGQGLARHILENREIVAGKNVLDFATGSGIVAIAAAMAGAAKVIANDVDPFCEAAIALNAKANNCEIGFHIGDLTGDAFAGGFDLILAGDVFYDRAMTDLLVPWLESAVSKGCVVLAGDPGRSYLPKQRLRQLAVYSVAVTRALEDSETKRTAVWQFTG